MLIPVISLPVLDLKCTPCIKSKMVVKQHYRNTKEGLFLYVFEGYVFCFLSLVSSISHV